MRLLREGRGRVASGRKKRTNGRQTTDALNLVDAEAPSVPGGGKDNVPLVW